ncbi:hypothetical protein C1Y63_09230 [Corynebacterium sp. 13CS0277]|uniref:hypothetical protein n=1 Tax=Corynebacterium sp. 13CS0277 TaxID=2071994 RepID=UPI000D033AB8|nr:hypothetical protein [Corynebacterium sp. 13CS0277]PRQ10908.1 hypothetical protein C1Y63_09230 [Corynebacterium sp. 13CS0277]
MFDGYLYFGFGKDSLFDRIADFLFELFSSVLGRSFVTYESARALTIMLFLLPFFLLGVLFLGWKRASVVTMLFLLGTASTVATGTSNFFGILLLPYPFYGAFIFGFVSIVGWLHFWRARRKSHTQQHLTPVVHGSVKSPIQLQHRRRKTLANP